jgi:hypothetical protein
LDQPSINEGVKSGTILPVQFVVQGTSIMGALKLLKPLSPTKFEAVIYHERDKGTVFEGSALERTVTKRKHGGHSEQVEFRAKIATVVSVQ